MCGYLVTPLSLNFLKGSRFIAAMKDSSIRTSDKDGINDYQKKVYDTLYSPMSAMERLSNRGPDKTNIEQINFNGVKFNTIHTLLSMTGEATPQPLTSDCGEYQLVFNGEIYNYKELSNNHKTDGYSIIDSYKEHGDEFTRHLRGEWSFVLFDHREKKLIISTDPFGTKPLIVGENRQGLMSFSSHKSMLAAAGYSTEGNEIFQINANTTVIFDFKKGDKKIKDSFTFDLKQHKGSYDDWSKAFLQSISRRFNNTGANNELNINNVFTYSIIGDEDPNILYARLAINAEKRPNQHGSMSRPILTSHEIDFMRSRMFKNEKFEAFHYGSGPGTLAGYNDVGIMGLGCLIRHTKSVYPNVRIVASGIGGDEIMTTLQTYTTAGSNPNPKKFPDDLSSVFPWDNFFGGTLSGYLSGVESIAGGFGLEGRYPYLDVDLVQEFLWLNADLKNKEYKAPLLNFLDEHNYPRSHGDPDTYKRGFNPTIHLNMKNI